MQKEQRHLLIGIITPLLLVAVLLIQLQQGQQTLTHAIISLHKDSPEVESEAPEPISNPEPPSVDPETDRQAEPKPEHLEPAPSAQPEQATEGPPPIQSKPMSAATPLPGELIEHPDPKATAESVVQLTYQPVTINHIYHRLQPYGRWFVHPRHGNVWMPHGSRRSKEWRPYAHNGRWHYTQNGWHWQSEYKWGGTTFHHGRWLWHEDNNGWVWVPGKEWSPAWVTWRDKGDHLGWAPMPPVAKIAHSPTPSSRPTSSSGIHIDYGLQHRHFTFVPKADFLSQNPIEFILGEEDALMAFQGSRSRDRIAVTSRRAWANFGIPQQEIARAIGSPIEMVAVDLRNPYQPRVVTMQELEANAEALEQEPEAPTVKTVETQATPPQGRPNPVTYWPGNRRYFNNVRTRRDAGANPSADPQTPIVINGATDTTNQRTRIQQSSPSGLGFRQGQARPNLSVRQRPAGK